MKYSIILSNPKDFYNEIHRTAHFIKFIKTEEEQETEVADKEDLFY